MISRRAKRAEQKSAHTSILSDETKQRSIPKRIVEVNDTWTKIKDNMDSGAASQVMPEKMFPRVKVQRNSTPKRFVAANGDDIRDTGEKTIPFKTSGRMHR